MRLLATLLASLAVIAPASAAVTSSCPRGLLESSGTHGLNIADTRALIAGIRSGAQVRVRVVFKPADKDSKSTEFWFDPVGVSVLDDVVYAESAPLRWAPSRYSWVNDSIAAGVITMRIASNGQLEWTQNEASAKSEPIEVAWCLR